MPTPAAIVFRPGRRSHRGRPGRRGNRSRFRVDFAGRCSASWEAAPSSASPVSAARAALRGVPEPPRRALRPWQLRLLRPLPRRGLWRPGRPLSATVVRRDRSRPPGHRNGRHQAAPDRARRRSLSLRPGLKGVIGSCLRAPHMRECALASERGGVAFGWPGADALSGSGVLLQPGEFSFQVWHSNRVRFIVAMAAALLGVGVLAAPPVLRRADRLRLPRLHPGHHAASGSRRAV